MTHFDSRKIEKLEKLVLPTIHFELDREYIADQLIKCSAYEFQNLPGAILNKISELNRLLAENHPTGLAILKGRVNFTSQQREHHNYIMQDMYNFVANWNEFELFCKETGESLPHLEKEWQHNVRDYSRAFHAITRLDLSTYTFHVKVCHPALPAGCNYGLSNIIGWRYVGNKYPEYLSSANPYYFPHYNGIYILHEVLHHSELLGDQDIEHAVIQLATDNEMRKRLTFQSYPPLIGHSFNLPYMERILPDWYDYLSNRQDENILQFAKRMGNKS